MANCFLYSFASIDSFGTRLLMIIIVCSIKPKQLPVEELRWREWRPPLRVVGMAWVVSEESSNESIQIGFELREFSLNDRIVTPLRIHFHSTSHHNHRHRHQHRQSPRPSLFTGKLGNAAPCVPLSPLAPVISSVPLATGTNYFRKIPVMDHLKDIM